MKNRMAALMVFVAVAAILLAVGLGGCKRTPVASLTPAQKVDLTANMLKDIRQSQADTGKNIAALTKELQERQTLEADEAGNPPVVRDLAVAKAALADARKGAESNSMSATGVALARLQRVVLSLRSELPGAIIARHADRALYQIQVQQSISSSQFMAASTAILAASDAAANGRPTSLVPDVLGDLKTAREDLEKGQPDAAAKQLNQVIDKTNNQPAAIVLSRTAVAVRGALRALAQQAWPVVAAELTEIDLRLQEISKNIGATTSTAAPPAPAAAPAGAPSASSAPVASANAAAPAPAPANKKTAPAPRGTTHQPPNSSSFAPATGS